MAPLTEARRTKQRSGDRRSFGVAASVLIYQGAMVAVDANGFATPMATSTTLQGVGRAEAQADNSSGANGAITVEVGAGIYPFANSAAADEINKDDIGKVCYGVDDQTVALTDGTGTRSPAGTIFDVDDAGVWVKFS